MDTRLKSWCHLVPDLPGYGKSPWPERPTRLVEQADFLARWMESRDTGATVILGHSMGGVVGLILCERHPELVRGFINVEGNVSLEDCTISAKVASYSIDELLAHGLRTIQDGMYRGGLKDRALRTYYPSLRLCDPRVYHLNSAELVEVSRTEQLAARLAALKMPVVYILGNPRGSGEHSRSLLSAAGVEWRAVEDAGHWPFTDQQTAFVEQVLIFLDRFS